jgi:hypothetical protein
MKTLKLKPQFAEIVDNPALPTNEKLKLILENTANHYNSTNRCADQQCAYHPDAFGFTLEQTEGCAVGRLFEPESAKLIDTTFPLRHSVTAISTVVVKSIEEKTLEFPEIFVNNRGFFQALQGFHDSKDNWNQEGLSETGKSTLVEIKHEFNLLN